MANLDGFTAPGNGHVSPTVRRLRNVAVRRQSAQQSGTVFFTNYIPSPTTATNNNIMKTTTGRWEGKKGGLICVYHIPPPPLAEALQNNTRL